ncbi:MAG: glycosyltransferase [Chloroflexia bacterium]
MVPDLSIVVLSWNVGELLARCLGSLPGAADGWWERTEVIVVDNASKDGSVEMVRGRFPWAWLIALSENVGFTRGNNTGIEAARGRYVLVLNPDTVAHERSIGALADYMEEYTDVGIAGPRLLNPDGSLQPSRRRFPTFVAGLVESTPLEQIFPQAGVLGRLYVRDRPDGETQEVDWLSGAALMCRAETLRQVGLFDSGYFMFSEEVDLCRRVSGAGWKVVYLPRAEVTHYGGQSTGQDVPARQIHFNTSKARYYRLHEGHWTGRVMRAYLLAVSAVQMASEGAKWTLGHKRGVRAGRVKMHVQVLGSGLREQRRVVDGAERVLLITGEYPPARGGVGDYTCCLGVALREMGAGVGVLAGGRGSGVGGRVPMASEIRSAKLKGPMRVERITVAGTLRALRGSGAGVAHIEYQTGAFGMRPTVNLLPWVLGWRWRGAAVVTFHDLRVPYLFPKAGFVREWANRALARGADGVVATNEADAERLRGWGARRVRVIPIGSNIANNPPEGYDREGWRREHGVGTRTVLLAYFGFLSSTKGLDDLLRGLQILRARGDFRLMMVGGGLGSSDPTNRATAAQVDALAAELGVRDALMWTGYLPPREISAALLAADMAVLPYADGASFRRGSLLAVLEHGLPVVSTMPGDVTTREALGGRPAAMLVEPGDPVGLAEAVWKVAEDAGLRKRLAAGALELAREFSWERIARMHMELYRELGGIYSPQRVQRQP